MPKGLAPRNGQAIVRAMTTAPPAAPSPKSRRTLAGFALLGLLGAVGCNGGATADPVPTPDLLPPPPPPERLLWTRAAPPTDTLGFAQAARGLRVVRGIIHLHSVYSHDACDGDPQPGGKPNAPCNANLRKALCETHQDFAMLTDHATHMSEAPFDKLTLADTALGDQPVVEGADTIGNTLRCDDAVAKGRTVLVTAGGENELMPVGLRHHLGDTPAQRNDNMKLGTPDAVRAFHAAGGAVLVPHGESRTIETLRALVAAGLDGMEVYNLHANIDPKIREPYLGLPALGAIAGLAPWLPATPVAEGGPEPDLALLGFLEPNNNQLGKYDTLLGEGAHLLAMMGSDIHENTFKQKLADDERGDSYRRLMRWFGNHLLVPKGAALTPQALYQAVTKERGYGVFEVLGSPEGFDFYADGPDPKAPAQTLTYELGDTAPPGATLHVALPRPFPAFVTGKEPVLRATLLRIAPGAKAGAVVETRFVSADELHAGVRFDVATATTGDRGPGAYRVELRMIPRHLLHLLGADAAMYAREYPYLYSSPIYVTGSVASATSARAAAK